MSEHERQALDLLDARGRGAAASLKAALARQATETPTVSADDHSRAPQTAHRNVWLAAAAMFAVGGLVAAFVALRDDPRADVSTGDPDEGLYLVPDWVPEGWQIQTAQNIDTVDGPAAPTGEVFVFGIDAAEDPWAASHFSLTIAHNMAASNTEDAQQIALGDQAASMESDGSTVVVQWTTDDGLYVSIAGYGLSEEVVVATATSMAAPPSIPTNIPTTPDLMLQRALAGAATAMGQSPEGAPAGGFVQMAHGPLSATTFMLTAGFDGLSMVYGDPESSVYGQIAVLQRPGDADDAELLRLASDDVEPTPVRDQTGYVQPDVLVQWFEPSTGMLVTVYGNGIDTDILLQVAESLRPARPGEIAEILGQSGQFGPAGPLEEGEEVVAQGGTGGELWRLIAQDDGDTWKLVVEPNNGVIDASESKDDAADVGVNVAASSLGDNVVVYGMADPQATSVFVQALDGSEIQLDLYDVDIPGWPTKAYIGLVPANSLADYQADVTARDASGEDLGSASLSTTELVVAP